MALCRVLVLEIGGLHTGHFKTFVSFSHLQQCEKIYLSKPQKISHWVHFTVMTAKFYF